MHALAQPFRRRTAPTPTPESTAVVMPIALSVLAPRKPEPAWTPTPEARRPAARSASWTDDLPVWEDDEDRAVWIPTPAEIAAEAARIRAENDRRDRVFDGPAPEPRSITRRAVADYRRAARWWAARPPKPQPRSPRKAAAMPEPDPIPASPARPPATWTITLPTPGGLLAESAHRVRLAALILWRGEAALAPAPATPPRPVRGKPGPKPAAADAPRPENVPADFVNLTAILGAVGGGKNDAPSAWRRTTAGRRAIRQIARDLSVDPAAVIVVNRFQNTYGHPRAAAAYKQWMLDRTKPR